jgi:Xaa-Pro aminopeptidase
MHAARRSRAQQAIAATGADAALITSLANVRYLSGLASSNAALLLPADGQGILATDSRYAGAATRDCQDLDLVIERDLEPVLVRAAAARGWGRLGFEAHIMTVERYTGLTRLEGAPELVPLGPVVEQLRMVKDEAEITLLARACMITDEAFGSVLGAIRPGLTERRLAVLLERAMVDLGAEGVAFATIVASGPNGAIPHHSPGDRELERGDLITIDCGARCQGYHADMT